MGPPPKLCPIPYERLLRYLDQGLSCQEVGRREGCTAELVARGMKSHGLPFHSYQSPTRRAELEGLIASGKTMADLAVHYGVSKVTIWSHLKYHGLATQAAQTCRVTKRRESTLDEAAVQRMAKAGATYDEMALTFGVPVSTLRRFCRQRGIVTARNVGCSRAKALTREHLSALVASDLCLAEMSVHTGVSKRTIADYCEAFGLKPRNGLEAWWLTRERLEYWIAKGLTAREIASREGVHFATVNQRLRQHSLQAAFKNPFTGANNESPPCEHLKLTLERAGIPFVPEFRPLASRGFRIDVAFPEQRIGLEVNGCFHYIDATQEILTPYHQERHDLITAAGWELLEIRCHRVWSAKYTNKLIGWLRTRLAMAA